MRFLCVPISFTYLARCGWHVESPLSLNGQLWKGALLPIPTWSASHAVSRLFVLVEGVVFEGEGRVVVLLCVRWVAGPLIASLSLAFLFVPSLLHPPSETRKVPSVSKSGSQQDSANQSISQSINQSVSHSVSQSVSQSASQPASQPASQSVSQSVNKSINQSINQTLMPLITWKYTCTWNEAWCWENSWSLTHNHNNNNRLTVYIIL